MGELTVPASTSASRRPGRNLWKPGQSGNPSGRPRHPDDLPAICREHTREAIDRLVQIMRAEDDGRALAAIDQLLNRGWGRPITPVVTDQPVESLSLLHLIAAKRIADVLQAEVEQRANESGEAKPTAIDFSIPALE